MQSNSSSTLLRSHSMYSHFTPYTFLLQILDYGDDHTQDMVKETNYFVKDASYILRKLKDREYVASNSYFGFSDVKQFYINIQILRR